LKSDIILIG